MFPKINEILFIQIASADEKEEHKEYKSRIADMDDSSFLIEVPMQQGSSRLKRLFSERNCLFHTLRKMESDIILIPLSQGLKKM